MIFYSISRFDRFSIHIPKVSPSKKANEVKIKAEEKREISIMWSSIIVSYLVTIAFYCDTTTVSRMFYYHCRLFDRLMRTYHPLGDDSFEIQYSNQPVVFS